MQQHLNHVLRYIHPSKNIPTKNVSYVHGRNGEVSMTLRNYVIRRLLIIVPTFFLISIIIFTLIHLAPGDPVKIMLGYMKGVTPQQVEELRKHFGLDQPIFVQYLIWVGRFLQGDLGFSYARAQSVASLISTRIGRTVELMILVQIVSLVSAVVVGVVSAVRPYSLTDSASKLMALIGYSAPSFWLGLIGIIVFAGQLNVLPSFGVQSYDVEFPTIFHVWFDHLKHLILPVIILSFGWMAYLLRLVRSSMLEVLRHDYIVTARAKGLSERVVIYKHALRNALLPVVTYEGYAMGFLLGGAAVIETVFSWPGLGKFWVAAASARDYPTLMGLSMVTTLMILLANLIADISYAVVDPRIRYD